MAGLRDLMNPGVKWLRELVSRASLDNPNPERAARSLAYGRAALDYQRTHPGAAVPPPGYWDVKGNNDILKALRQERADLAKAYRKEHPDTSYVNSFTAVNDFPVEREIMNEVLGPSYVMRDSGREQLNELKRAALAKKMLEDGDTNIPPFGIGFGSSEKDIYEDILSSAPRSEQLKQAWKAYDDYMKGGAGMSVAIGLPREYGAEETWNPLESALTGATLGGMAGNIPGALVGGLGGLALDALMELGLPAAYDKYVAPRATEYGRNFVFYPPSMEEY